MSWVTIIWSMVATACLTLAAVHLLVWWRQRKAWAHAVFAPLAVATTVVAACELWMMRAETAGEFGKALRWFHVPGWMLVVSLVGFVRLYMRAGRPWLAWAVCGMRTLALILNFVFTPNLNYREITALRHIRFLGESVSVVDGVPNPWMLVGQTSLLLLVVFVVDATLTVWRKGDRRQALLLGGTMAICTVAGTGITVLSLWGIIHAPITTSLCFLGMIVTMGYEMSVDVLRSAQLSLGLRESEERFRQVAETAGEFIWEVDAKGLYTYASPSVEKLLGYTPKELVGKKHFYDLFVPSVREEMKAAALQVFANRQTFRDFPNSNVSKSGEIVHLETSGSPVLDPAGNLVGYRGADMDVTARKQSEEELEQHRNQLAHLSRVSMLGELAGSLAHELNQPLAVILSNAQAAQRFLAHDQTDINEVRDILADIVAADKRAGEVIRRLRVLLKQGEVQRQPLDVNEVVQEVLKMMRNDLVNQGVSAQTELAPDLPVLHADRVQLQQVLLNLVMNACDAMAGAPRDDRQLTIRTGLAGDGSVRISVCDGGAGIAPGKLEQVFDAFYSTKPHGMGLGLPVCRTIVTAHGGKLWATNNPERGATFHFTLPVNGKGQGEVARRGALA